MVRQPKRWAVVDAGYIWRTPSDEGWEAIVSGFHRHMAKRKKGGER
jgi:hypothetical protein